MNTELTINIMRTVWIVIMLMLITVGSKAQSTEKLVHDLSSRTWFMEGTLPGEGVNKLFHKYIPDAAPASVPGDVYTDLWRVGRIDDPHFGTNSQKAKWIMDYEWWYFRNFNIPKNMEGKEIRILFEGVDYACDVYLNGEYLGSHEGMLSHFSFNISELVKLTTKREPKDNNFLAVRLHPAPRTLALVNGRKYRWHGDYNQNVTPTGIWQPVKLVATGTTRITDVYTRPVLEKNGSAIVELELELTNDGSAAKDIEANIQIEGKNFESKSIVSSISQKIKPGVTTLKTSIKVIDPELWWPWDMGEQNLYTAKVLLKSGAEFQDAEVVTFGIREVKMEMNPGWTDEQVKWPWTVMINGKRHFVRSGTWGGPPDIFTGRTSEDTYRELIRLAKEANINNLRIFNWHPPEIPLFYELCNEAGITVWQDIVPINNPILHHGEEYKQAMFNEAIASLKQRRNNPCNIIIEGSEEILYMSSQSAREYQLSIVEELGEVLEEYTDLHYIPTSPLGGHFAVDLGFSKYESGHPHGVHYGMGNVFMEDYYSMQEYAAIPELAVTSCPNVESIKRFIPEDELWPPGPSWGYHWADLDILQGHNYEVFGEDFTDKTLEEFVNATQIAQGIYFQYSMELYRTRKPKMSALCFCHFILNTPDFKWATVDYYLQPKESHYYIQKCYQPLLITLQYERRRWMPGETFEGKIWIVNDYIKDFKGCNAILKVLDDEKQLVEEQIIKIGKVEEDSAEEITDISFVVPGKMGDTFYVEIEMTDQSGKIVSANDYLLLVDDQQKALEYYKKYGKKYRERRDVFGPATNRYFPGLFDNRKSTKADWIRVEGVHLSVEDKETQKESGIVTD